jgi:hypothetical protein
VALKRIQEMRKMRDLGGRRHVRSKGMHGIRKRGSWCGKMERRTVADTAETARLFFTQIVTNEREKRQSRSSG